MIDTKKVDKLRVMADKMQTAIDGKLADRLENTPKRMAQAASARNDGYHLQRAQQLLYKIADGIENETLPDILNDVKTKKAAMDLTHSKSAQEGSGFHYYRVDTNEPLDDADEKTLSAWSLLDDKVDNSELEKLKSIENKIRLSKIEGFFPTPDTIVDDMVQIANIYEGEMVLEPNAGSGNILSKLPNGTKAIEYNHSLCELLKLKGYEVEQGDFLQHTVEYDKIVMNPPFEKQADIKHVTHAFNLLHNEGRVVAIMSAGVEFREDKRTKEFRDLVAEHGYMEKLPDKTFNESGTNVSTIMVVLDK